VTVVGFMGATESLLLMEFFHLLSYFSPLSNAVMTETSKKVFIE
jgi:hypothetical protein